MLGLGLWVASTKELVEGIRALVAVRVFAMMYVRNQFRIMNCVSGQSSGLRVRENRQSEGEG